jgi:hypothetical protein
MARAPGGLLDEGGVRRRVGTAAWPGHGVGERHFYCALWGRITGSSDSDEAARLALANPAFSPGTQPEMAFFASHNTSSERWPLPVMAPDAEQLPSPAQDRAVDRSRYIARRLYVSHFLSTWNSRLFEFGAVLFIAAVYPDTLLPASIYALARAASAIFLSPVLGYYVDTGNRLQVVRVSILGQRLSTTISCCGFLLLVSDLRNERIEIAVLVVLALLSCIEKLCSVLNTIAVERDWVCYKRTWIFAGS